MIQEAAEFAAKAHEGMVRKGSRFPYIVHPMEVAMIVSVMTDDPDMIAAAYLHDVIEDAGVRYEELRDLFGLRVADLVRAESEDKTKSWKERKAATIEHLQRAGRDEKMLAFGDKLSNLRSTAMDYLVMGDDIWQKFREKDKAQHAWYYGNLMQVFQTFDEFPFYKEYEMLWQRVFGGENE